jgi:hypothetical protein
MRLTGVTLQGFRRFRERTTVRIEGPVTALIGPNEAGKSSFLHALTLLNGNEPILDKDVTRGIDRHDVEIVAMFALEDRDREALSHLPDGAKVRTCRCTKREHGEVIIAPSPRIPHDLTGRSPLVNLMEGIDKFTILSNATNTNAVPYQAEDLNTVRKALSGSNLLNQHGVTLMRKLANGIEDAIETWPAFEDEIARLSMLPDALRAQAEHEADPAPTAASAILRARMPKFLAFKQAARDLHPSYRLSVAADDPPEALKNLLRLADLDAEKIVEAIDNERPNLIPPLLDSANARLQSRFREDWVHDEVRPAFQHYSTDLLVNVYDFDGKQMSPIDERSDGLRWFVAMVAFVNAQDTGRSKPILLVANLVIVMSNQPVAQKVIYTTHSAGCLPPDLGTGIKPVQPSTDEDRSTIYNSFWHHDPEHPGFTALMLAMGASALAFTPARNVVVGEGASECILLPTLLREATGQDTLSYQVAPGLSQASEATLPTLFDAGARVVFLCDADTGDKHRCDWLRDHGAGDNAIVYDDPKIGLDVVAIEDLLKAEVYAAAVNSILGTYNVSAERVDPDEVPATDRSNWLNGWLKRNGIDPRRVQKPSVCQEAIALAVTEDGDRTPIVASGHKRRLKRLDKAFTARLKEAVRPGGTGGS